MNRARSSLDKPPLAVSRGGFVPAEAPQLRRSCAPEESPLVSQYERISQELQALAQRAKDNFPAGDTAEGFASVAKLAAGPTSPFLERGRLYEIYSMEETFEEMAPRHSAAEADLGKRKSAKRTESLRKSAPENFLSGPASRLRSSVTTRGSKGSSSVLSSMKLKIDGEKLSYLQSGRRK
ncbi:unnamed protein product [Spirodela intermedia]|uniref:Uncharacterized protein n=1 Tax=Spirodela intermedia TaxID=51605 RepID=A0A7I8J969_SPIIN|nr:unnamed protein product [Spirodela intermedia]CAA6666758.1 unnamed protein product [Spirodela intermedia]